MLFHFDFDFDSRSYPLCWVALALALTALINHLRFNLRSDTRQFGMQLCSGGVTQR